jgi:hypothetical protein
MVVEFCHNLLLNLFVWFLRFAKKPKFGKWVRLEEQKNKILRTVEESSDDFPQEVFTFLSTVLHLPVQLFHYSSWETVVKAFYLCVKMTACQLDLAIFSPTKDKPTKEAWDYDGRMFNLYVHVLSSNYGWDVEYINNLPVATALSLIQEILLEDQLQKEFEWGMSDKSSYYDSTSKATKLNPLPRPGWMNRHIDPAKELKVTNIPDGMKPAGNGISQNDLIAQASQL